MKIFAIESSCDETACAVVEDGQVVLSSVISSQIEVHRPFGGIVPEIASREHLTRIMGIADQALQESRCSWSDIDAIAVTQGPGLIGSLLVGISFAKGLAMALGKPLIPVDHIHAHIYGAVLGLDATSRARLQFPLLAMVVSGGHTNLYFMKESLDFNLIGYSMDDACGECFDKVAKMFGLSYPGGPEIEILARQGESDAFAMPKQKELKGPPFLFSYSGLKTHMVNTVRQQGGAPSGKTLADLCASFQKAAFDQILSKLKEVLKTHQAKSLIISGGVSANGFFRKQLDSTLNLPIFLPGLAYCGDNAAMIGALAFQQITKATDLYNRPPVFDWDAYSKYNFKNTNDLHQN